MNLPPLSAALGPPPSAETLALVADALAWPLLVLRADGGLVHANRAARQMLQRGQPLALTAERRVVPAESRQRAGFEAALEEAASGRGHGLLRWPDSRGAFTATLVPLTGGQGSVDATTVLLAIGSPATRTSDTRNFAAMHGLSAAETRVLERLVLGESSAAAAAALGVKAATVRSQAISLRRKTGHGSVADLLRALAAMPPLSPPLPFTSPSPSPSPSPPRSPPGDGQY